VEERKSQELGLNKFGECFDELEHAIKQLKHQIQFTPRLLEHGGVQL
jgi:hypothetical protein